MALQVRYGRSQAGNILSERKTLMRYINVKLADSIKELMSELELTSPCHEGNDEDTYDIFITRLFKLLEKENPSEIAPEPIDKAHKDRV